MTVYRLPCAAAKMPLPSRSAAPPARIGRPIGIPVMHFFLEASAPVRRIDIFIMGHEYDYHPSGTEVLREYHGLSSTRVPNLDA